MCIFCVFQPFIYSYGLFLFYNFNHFNPILWGTEGSISAEVRHMQLFNKRSHPKLSHLFPLRIIPHDVSCGTVCSQLWGRKVTTTMPLTHADTLKWSWRSMEEKEAVLDEFCLICSPSVITTLPSLLLTSCLLSLIPQDTTRVTNTAVELQWWQIKQRDWIHYNTTAYRGLYQQENSNTNVISAETRSHLSIM